MLKDRMTREDYEYLKQIIGEILDPKIEAIVHARMDKLEEQLKKVERIDNIISDVKELFK